MKLRFKKTGEVVEVEPLEIFNTNGNLNLGDAWYSSIKDFVADWEDAPEEPKEYWFIGYDAQVECISENDSDGIELDKSIGNYFKTEEEAEKAVERLRAWKRLKDKGLRFDGYDVAHKSNGNLAGQIFYDAGDYSIEDIDKEMALLFGGEE